MLTQKNLWQLVIGNKNYSSWSMRPWLVLSGFGIEFEEIRIPLTQPDTDAQIARYSQAGHVPVLVHNDLHIWDSLAICEYLAEQFPHKNMWPHDSNARAIVRSMCVEMHSGFTAIRSAMSMDIQAHFPGKGHTPEALTDVARISAMWSACLAEFGGNRFLFGEFSIADAFFAPVVLRFNTYEPQLSADIMAYCARVMAHPAVTRWVNEALLETEVCVFA